MGPKSVFYKQIYSPKLHNIAKIGSEISSLDIICQTKLCLQFKVYSILWDLDIEIYARNYEKNIYGL